MTGWYVALALYVLAWLGFARLVTVCARLLSRDVPRWALVLVAFFWPLCVLWGIFTA